MAENKDYKYVDHYDFNEELLKQAFAEARRIYKERGFMRKMGFGKAPARHYHRRYGQGLDE